MYEKEYNIQTIESLARPRYFYNHWFQNCKKKKRKKETVTYEITVYFKHNSNKNKANYLRVCREPTKNIKRINLMFVIKQLFL